MFNDSDQIDSAFFDEQGSGYFLKKDVYDDNGNLLLAKGRKITSATKRKLENMGVFRIQKPDNSAAMAGVIPAKSKQTPDTLVPTIQSFGRRKSIYNDHITQRPYRILTSIVFESRSNPWWVLVNAMIDYSEPLYTHSIDVAMISLMLAAELGYSNHEQWNLGLGAFLHDIGKVLLPKSIIKKQDAMMDTEPFYIQQHCELGANSLKLFDLAKECTDIVLHHHEHLDGSGYPEGLKNNEISKEAQIVMVADVLDNLSSTRPNRSAYTIDAAINVLKNDKRKYPQNLVLMLEKILKP